jgi:flagellar protein FlaG
MLIQNANSATPQAATPAGIPVASSPDIQTVATPQAAQAPQAAPSTAQLQSAVQSSNQAISGKGLEFSVDTSTNQTVVKLMDTQSDTVIGQFPSQQMIDISKSIGLMQEQLQQASLSRTPVQASPGLLIKQQA